jgi:hypothetical protein
MEPKPTYETEAEVKAKAASTSTLTSTSTSTCALPAAEIAERWWLAFTPDHEPTAAAARFIERTGAPPEYLVKTPTMLLVGPLSSATRPPRPEAEAEPAVPVRKSLKERIGPQLALL